MDNTSHTSCTYALTDLHMARLNARFEMPLVVQSFLQREEKLAGEETLALHTMLSDLPPDTALLVLALSGLYIERFMEKRGLAVPMLSLACQEIVSDYGVLWLQHADQADGMDLYNSRVFTLLDQMAEDLECLTDLFGLCEDLVHPYTPWLAELLSILSIQANAQKDIMHALLETAEDHDVLNEEDDIDLPPEEDDFLAPAFGPDRDNIVQFRRPI